MVKQHGEAAGVPRAIQSQGEDEAKAYAVGEVAPAPLHPTLEMERVRIEDPRRVPPPREGARRGGGPRNPEQRVPLSDAGAPSVSMPEGLSVTKRQPIVIDSEILAEWHGGRGGGEERGSEGAGSEAAEGDEATGSAGTGHRAPRLAEIAAARRTERRAGRQRAAWVLAMGVLLAIGVTVLRSVWGAGGGAGEEARGAGEAAEGDVALPAETAGAAAKNAGAPEASAARAAGAPAVETAGAPAAETAGAPAAEAAGAPAASTFGPRGAAGGAVVPSQESGPSGQAAPKPAAPRPRATAPAAPRPRATGSAAPVRGAESAPAPSPPSPDDKQIFD
ncbi:hypothetical protein [Sorangium sp. So ce426]|uniref:hypothetical protein n=1 Tax=Sorangium sp. So ce426 TaxID=3133312 RepID=UPI003F5B3868